MPSHGAVQQNPKKTKSKEEHQQHLAPFTVKDLRDAIPDHCFERSLLKSSSYLLADFAMIGVLVSISYYFNNHISEHTSWPVAFLFWSVMWFLQGVVMTGVWVIGHECGHQSFSKSKTINDAVGWVIHSMLLVPYHSWRITHGMHHKNTSHMTRDQVFVPKTRTQVHGDGHEDLHNVIAESPIGNLIQIVIATTIGWPFYLATNAWGQDYKGGASHFKPSSAMFKPQHKSDVIISNIGMVIVLSTLALFSYNYSFASAVKYYIIPYFWSNFWLVSITYLQHTDKRVPHFRGEEWNFIRGALSTIDRDYGILNHFHHHIADTHVAHHLFSQMPHYHAEEATECIKKVLGNYYMEDRQTSPIKALWDAWQTCHYVDDEGSVVYYKTVDFKKKQK